MADFDFVIRPYEPRDLEKVRHLDRLVDPYLREHAADVEAMFTRAADAPRPKDRWGTPYSADFETVLTQGYLAVWVAAGGEDRDGLAGVVGVQRFHDGPEVGDLEPAIAWLKRADVAELVHLRVLAEARRQGVGERLVREVIAWSREAGYRLLVLNTSTPQFPARRLYERLGFREAGIAYLDGKYEVVWYQKDLSP